jgi:hypothetical protein
VRETERLRETERELNRVQQEFNRKKFKASRERERERSRRSRREFPRFDELLDTDFTAKKKKRSRELHTRTCRILTSE